MTIVDSLNEVADWLNNTACQKFMFKVPPDNPRTPVDDGYSYETTHPHAFPMFIPAKDKVPPGIISNIPSICVQLVKGEDDNAQQERTMSINLGISCWNPGIHAKDWFYPNGKRPEKPEKFKIAEDGWMDAWNLVDDITRRLGSTSHIGGLEIIKSKPVTFGPYKEQDAIPDFYPMWFAWIQFDVQSVSLRHDEEIDQFL